MGIDMMKWDKMYYTQFSFHSRYPSWVTEVLKRWRGEVWAMTNGYNYFETHCVPEASSQEDQCLPHRSHTINFIMLDEVLISI